MLRVEKSSRFKKDIDLIKRQNKDIELLKAVLERLVNETPLEPKHRNHNLTGEYGGRQECHIKPDWLLIYQVYGDVLYLDRTGSHAELFD
jgi:mRNA interferase YafQ